MKFRNIIVAGLSAVALSACSDYLDVDAPSKNEVSYVYSDLTEMGRALNGVYATAMSGNAYGSKMISTYTLNSDVDFASYTSDLNSSNSYRRYDCDADGSDLNSTWSTLYKQIELANLFVENAKKSHLCDKEASEENYLDVMQMIGEAKVLRAIAYHDLIWMFGDVPFSMASTQETETLNYPVTDRAAIIDALIADLKDAALEMKYTTELSDGVERISKEMAWAMTARLAQTAAGYTLRPEGNTYGKMVRMNANYQDYYKTVIEYGDSVIASATHRLSLPFHKVFVNECNFIPTLGDDVIWEIPFAKESTGQIGYIHGIKMDDSSGETVYNYGKATSGAQLNSFYRFMFDPNDVRRDYVNQLTYITSAGVFTLHNNYSVENGKWSKLWVNGGLGKATTDATGINYPYMRYADVLLMFAEAVNEVENGFGGEHGADAAAAFAQVRGRAFPNNPELVEAYITDKAADQETLRNAILDERKFEFAGENMRWRDLVRHNLLGENLYWTFYRYYGIAMDQAASFPDLDIISLHDYGVEGKYDKMPLTMYYYEDHSNVDDVTGAPVYPESVFPNQEMKICQVLNPYDYAKKADLNALGYNSFKDADYMNWQSEGEIRDQIKNSLFGYIYVDQIGRVMVRKADGTDALAPDLASMPKAADLPVVRYIMPYPTNVITRAKGKLVNSYGYSK